MLSGRYRRLERPVAHMCRAVPRPRAVSLLAVLAAAQLVSARSLEPFRDGSGCRRVHPFADCLRPPSAHAVAAGRRLDGEDEEATSFPVPALIAGVAGGLALTAVLFWVA